MKVRLIISIVLSLIIGFGGGFLYRSSCARKGWESPWRDPDSVMAFLSRKLELRDDQLGKVRTAVEGAREKISALRQRIRPEFKAIHDQTHDEIAVVLDENQKKSLAELRKEFEARRQARLEEREKRGDD